MDMEAQLNRSPAAENGRSGGRIGGRDRERSHKGKIGGWQYVRHRAQYGLAYRSHPARVSGSFWTKGSVGSSPAEGHSLDSPS